ncbi:MAG: hypothetical protein GDA52_10760 [Rhodobacteraceae bacterium]|nr:hypothetical protein [Paracoccaceae bacterium]
MKSVNWIVKPVKWMLIRDLGRTGCVSAGPPPQINSFHWRIFRYTHSLGTFAVTRRAEEDGTWVCCQWLLTFGENENLDSIFFFSGALDTEGKSENLQEHLKGVSGTAYVFLDGVTMDQIDISDFVFFY